MCLVLQFSQLKLEQFELSGTGDIDKNATGAFFLGHPVSEYFALNEKNLTMFEIILKTYRLLYLALIKVRKEHMTTKIHANLVMCVPLDSIPSLE